MRVMMIEPLGRPRKLRSDFLRDGAPGDVGPVCADALRQYGVTPQVMPSKGKIGFMVNELAAYRAVNRLP